MKLFSIGWVPLLLALTNLVACGLKSPLGLVGDLSRSQSKSIIQKEFISDPTLIAKKIADFQLYTESLSEPKRELEQFADQFDIGLGANDISKTHIIVKFSDLATEQGVQEALKSNAKLERESNPDHFENLESSGAKIVPLPTDQSLSGVLAHIAALKELAGVEYVSPDYQVKALRSPNDPYYPKQYALNQTGQRSSRRSGIAGADIYAPEAWDISTGSKDVAVAIIDSGIDYTHPDLINNIWLNPGETGTDANGKDKRSNGIDDDENGYIDDFRGWDFVDNDNDPMDQDGHGTHVAGIIGASGNNNLGTTGVNWAVSLVPLRALDSNGTGFNSNIIKAVEYARMMGFPISNNSYGGGDFDQSFKDALDSAQNANMLFVVAAGNSAANNDTTPSYPASYPQANILVVGASDNIDQLASFSNYGLTSVHLVAPGLSIFSTFLDKSYAYLSGTSMAAPSVAGAAALIKASSPSLSYLQIKSRIIESVDRRTQLQTKISSGGRLNLARALGVEAPSISGVNPSAGPLSVRTTIQISGKNFREGAVVQVGGKNCTDIILTSSELLTCNAPTSTNSRTVSITVLNSNGLMGTLPLSYTYRSIPLIKSIIPLKTSIARVSSGKVIEISGQGFSDFQSISVGSQVCSSPFRYGDTYLECTLTATLGAGIYPVVVTNSIGQKSNELNIEIIDSTPRWVPSEGGSCGTVCKEKGLESVRDSAGASCTSGTLIPASALLASPAIDYKEGCYPNTSCTVAQGNVFFATSVGKYCYRPMQVREFKKVDLTMGCFCGF